MAEAAKELNLDIQDVKDVLNRKLSSINFYKFKYVNKQ